MPISYTLQNLFSSTLSDNEQAQATARWLTSRTSDAQQVLSAAATAMTLDEEDVQDYLDGLDDDLMDVELIAFSDDPTVEAKLFRVEDLILAYAGVETGVEGLTSELAEKTLDDLSTSTAAVTAAAVGASKLCSQAEVSTSELIASIEAEVGGVSDQMLTTTSVIAPILSSSNLCVGDKIKNILAAIGLYKDHNSYTGFGPLVSDLYEYTGASGINAFVSGVQSALQSPVTLVEKVFEFVGGFIVSVFSRLASKVANRVSNVATTLAGVNDAVLTREEGQYSDYTCDLANTYLKFPSTIFSETQLSKIHHEYALHVNCGFGTIDFWFEDSNRTNVNAVIHWKPVNVISAMWYANQVSLDEHGMPRWRNPRQIFESRNTFREFYNALTGRLWEAETTSDLETFISEMALIFDTQPVAGSCGVDDENLYFGIVVAQLLAIGMWSRTHGISYDTPGLDLSAEGVGFVLYRSVPANITNIDVIKMAGMVSQDADTTVSGSLVHDYWDEPDWNVEEFSAALGFFVQDVLQSISEYQVGVQNACFIPYFYVSSYVTGKYALRTDSDVNRTIQSIFWFVGTVVVGLLVIAASLLIKKRLWVAQASLDYHLFDADVAENPKLATKLYKKSCKLARANSLIGIIVGSAKSAVSKVFSVVSGIGNAITGKVGGLLGSGSQQADQESNPPSLSRIITIITGE